MQDAILTTIDNPFDPFTDWDSWLKFDHDNGYDTCELLARFSKTSSGLSDLDNETLIDEAMNSIIELFPGVYIKVFKQANTNQAESELIQPVEN